MKLDDNWITPFSDRSADPQEFANTMTHGFGFLLSVLGAIVMTVQVLREGDRWRVVGCLVYVLSLMTVYAMSTLSHSCLEPKLRHFFRKLDQAFIYFLIVGTYTPFSLAFLRASHWWLMLGVMWAIAISGFVSKTCLAHRIDTVSVWIYIALGWMPIMAAYPLAQHLGEPALWWILIGGLCYTVGTPFLVFDHVARHFHALWHLLVIAGSASHFFVIFSYVASNH